ncbi:MAG TPA: hypothetical protein VKU41_08015, partial [Polyangiaceae bacterium]|nr:hypothetical protein [Polyangiaceae bacterium]
MSSTPYWHCRDAETACAAESELHLTIRVPPWLSALQVLVQVTVHVAPEAQVTLDPAPAET